MENYMLIEKPLPFVTTFIEALNDAIKIHQPGSELSRTQKYWLSFCVMAILITNSVCWARFERASIGKYSMAALSWMFHHSKIPWDLLLQLSIRVVLLKYDITEGVISIDDTDNKRSKSTKFISWVHKIKDKASGGYIMGQSLVFLVLITSKITIPVGFSFYVPDPELTAWNKKDKKLKKQGVIASKRPAKPLKNDKYPTMIEIALTLLKEFQSFHPGIKIKCIVADALYGTNKFLTDASNIFGGTQVISQIRKNQNIRVRGKEYSVEEYFSKHPGVPQKIKIRGDEKVAAIIGSGRFYVCAHGKKCFVIALKYEGEKEYRYLVAADLSWRTLDIVQAYTLRWLVEVFFEDWKANEGWVNLTKLTGKEGSRHSLILSLLVDHCLFFHPDQLARIENKLSACTVGSLRLQIMVESLFVFIHKILDSENINERLALMKKYIKEFVFTLSPSKKHMVGRNLGRLEPTPSLKYRTVT